LQNGFDPVTRIPFHGRPPFDYRHTGHHVWLRHEGTRIAVEQAARNTGGVRSATLEVYEPVKALQLGLKGAIKGDIGRGLHRMGGIKGYLASISNATWSTTHQHEKLRHHHHVGS
jgi:hypothetical protein